MITVRGARQHNLRGVDLDLPVDAVVVLCGRSGSGKTSLALDTLHAEAWRRYLEAMAPGARRALPSLPRPDVDVLHGLPPTVALSQHGWRPPAPATLASAVELERAFAVLFGRVGDQRCPVTGVSITPITHDGIVARILALPAGARVTLEAPIRASGPAALDEARRAGFSRVRVGDEVVHLDEVRGLPDGAEVRVVIDRIKVDHDRKDRLYDAVRVATAGGRGVYVVTPEATWHLLDRPYSAALDAVLPARAPALFRRGGAQACEVCAGADPRCATCGGTGLGLAARHVWVADLTWRDVMTRGAAALRGVAWPDMAIARPVVDELRRGLDALVAVGLGEVALGAAVASLSTGQWQRARLAGALAQDLSGVLYVLDEPTAGLDAAGVGAVVEVLRGLVARGNGVIAVEHHPAVIAAADHVVVFGPGPGRDGGQVVYQGPPAGMPPGMAGYPPVVPAGRRGAGELRVGDTAALRGGVTAITGPTASGKSARLAALASAVSARVDGHHADVAGADGFTRVVTADEVAAGRSRRSTPASYVGLWTTLRELFAATADARLRGLGAPAFSVNLPGGRCEACVGLGVVHVDLEFLPPVAVPCEACGGRRFSGDVLGVRYKGRHAGEWLDATVAEAAPLLTGHPKLEDALRALREVGLGYVALGQPTVSLSGGELRRLALARELVRAGRAGAEGVLYALDEPTIGLAPGDVADLLRLLDALADQGATVVVATGHPMVVAAADRVVALSGPGAG